MHPLAVHAPVVLVPIATVVALVLAVKSDWRRRLGWWMPAAVLVLAGLLFVAKQSGEAVAAVEPSIVFGDITEHQKLAETTMILGVVWFVLTAGLAAWDWRARRGAAQTLSGAGAPVESDVVSNVLAVVVAVAAIVTTIWLIRTGHAGAAERWPS